MKVGWGALGFLCAVLSALELFWCRQHGTVWRADLAVNLFSLGPQCRAVVKPTGPAESFAEVKRSQKHEDILTGTKGSEASFPLQTPGVQTSVWVVLDVRVHVSGHVGPSHIPPRLCFRTLTCLSAPN